MKENLKIFISHAWEDNSLVSILETRLKEAGAEVWVDRSFVFPGDSLPKRISDALKWCNTMLLIWSEPARQSRWVNLEWENALSLNKKIIPCLVDSAELPSILSNTIYQKLNDADKGISELLNTLSLGNTVYDRSLSSRTDISEISRIGTKSFKLPQLPNVEFDAEKECQKLLKEIDEFLDPRYPSLKKIGVSITKSVSDSKLIYGFRCKNTNIYFLSFWIEFEYGKYKIGAYDGFTENSESMGKAYTCMISLSSDVNYDEPIIEILNFSLIDMLKTRDGKIDKSDLMDGIWNKIIRILEQVVPQKQFAD